MSRYYVLETDGSGHITPAKVIESIYNGLNDGTVKYHFDKRSAHADMLEKERNNPDSSFDVFTVERTKW